MYRFIMYSIIIMIVYFVSYAIPSSTVLVVCISPPSTDRRLYFLYVFFINPLSLSRDHHVG